LRPSLAPGVPRRASSQALRATRPPPTDGDLVSEQRETLPEVGYAGERDYEPPRAGDSEPPRPRYSDAQQKRYWQEQTAESKALEAWANAESGDPIALKKAVYIVEKAIEFFPNNPQIRFYAGCLYRRAQHLDRAATEFRRVLSLDPHNLEAKRELESIGRQSLPPPSKSVFGRLLKKR
jgi:tetratricopeptide (TPR) repeat protein